MAIVYIIIGFILGLLFVFLFLNKLVKKHYIIKKPELKLIFEEVYEIESENGKKCYKLEPIVVKCSNS